MISFASPRVERFLSFEGREIRVILRSDSVIRRMGYRATLSTTSNEFELCGNQAFNTNWYKCCVDEGNIVKPRGYFVNGNFIENECVTMNNYEMVEFRNIEYL